MAYNGYQGYSPYFQESEQDGRSQATYSGTTSGNGTYQRQPYQPMTSAPTSYTTAQASSERTTNTYPPRYADLESSNGGVHNARAGNHITPGMNAYHTNPRSSIDTTALGNLAYASSLGQDSRQQPVSTREGSSLQPLADYNRSQAAAIYSESASYGLTSTTSDVYDHRRSDSRGTVHSRENVGARNSPNLHATQYGNYNASNEYGNQQPQVFSRLEQGAQTSESHVSRFDSGAPMQPARQYSAHRSRPASGQGVHTSQATTSPKPIHSPHPTAQTRGYPPPSVNRATKEPGGADLSKRNPQPSIPPIRPGISNSKSGPSTSKPAVSRPKGKVPRNTPKQASNTIVNSQPTPAYSASDQHHTTPVSQLQDNQSPTVDVRTNGYNSGHETHTDMQYPTTVDPNQVFNHYEYEKRQAAAAAAVKKNDSTATEANATAPVASSLDLNTKDQMELEMKQMIEKMRDYKAKDPSLFSQIWEQVKKGQPSNLSSQAPPSIGPSNTEKASTSETDENEQIPGSINNQLPQESDLSVEPLQDGPDLGKSPAERRRTKGNKDSPRRISKVHKSQKLVLDVDNHTPGLFYPSPPAVALHPTNIKESSNTVNENQSMQDAMNKSHVDQKTPNKVNGNQSMQDAMKRFNVNLAPHGQSSFQSQHTSIAYARGVGPPLTDPATSIPQSQPIEGTIWPEESKVALAFAATDALISSVLNAGRSIAAEEIIRLLDQNPSYTDLCENLERRGFIIDRGHFARILLAAVPGLDSGQSGQDGTAINGATNGMNNHDKLVNGAEALKKKELPKSKPLKPKKLKALDNVQTPANSTRFKNDDHSQFRLNSIEHCASESAKKRNLTQANLVQPQAQIERPASIMLPAPSKKEMARKRSFGELVDLSQDLSDEDDTFRRVLKARLDEGFCSSIPTNASAENIKFRDDAEASKARSVSPSVAFENDLCKKLLKNLEGRKSGSSSAATDDEGSDASHFKYSASQRELLRSKSIVRQIDKRHDALRRSTYNPKTIARDVLVATGKHPTMAPLNFHLGVLRKKFRNVEYNSDLSTFRWDLVDPGGPGVGALGDHDLDMNDADDEDAGLGYHGAEPLIRRPMVASMGPGEPNVSSDINITQPIKTMSQRKWKVPRPSDTEIRRIVAGVENGHHKTPQSLGSEGMMTFSRASDDNSIAGNTPLATTEIIHKSPRGRPRKKPKPTEMESPKQEPAPGQRRRGRPPGSKTKTTPKSNSGDSTMIPSRSRPFETAAITPSGLRNAMTPSDRVAVVIGAGSSTVPDSSVEKSRKSTSRQQSTPQHKIYKCRWKGCPSELHNLETLRKHVYKHCDQFSTKPFPCLWSNCVPNMTSNDEEETDEGDYLQFETEADWTEHMSGKHLDRHAWELGDGPSAHPSDAEASDYLSDSRGRQVTPVARASGPSDPMDLSSSRRTIRAYHKAHGNTTEVDKAHAVLKAVEAKKRATGLGIDRGGSTFVTPKMRELVAEAHPGISKVVEEDF